MTTTTRTRTRADDNLRLARIRREVFQTCRRSGHDMQTARERAELAVLSARIRSGR